jgi:hypothetical protein
VLEQISDAEVARPSNLPSPGVTIVIRAPVEQTIRDVTPASTPASSDTEFTHAEPFVPFKPFE